MEIQLYNEDCLVALSKLPDSSVDLVLTDPPYNISKASWDKIPDYINWCGKWIKECERVLKDNGSFYFWHNDMVQIAQLMEWIRQNTRFVFNSFCVWDKGDFRALSWKNPSEANNLRSWFSTCEYCLFYTFQDETGLEQILPACFTPYLDYMTNEKNTAGMNVKSVNVLTGYVSIASHWFWQEPQKRQTQPRFIGESDYRKLQSTGFWQRPYEALRQEYEDLRYVHNLDANHNNVWKSKEHNNGKLHVCQKPLDITERIIKTSTKEGATVLDCFMGSGTTGVACVNTRRNFIGIELDEGYYRIAQERIEAAKGLLFNMV